MGCLVHREADPPTVTVDSDQGWLGYYYRWLHQGLPLCPLTKDVSVLGPRLKRPSLNGFHCCPELTNSRV